MLTWFFHVPGARETQRRRISKLQETDRRDIDEVLRQTCQDKLIIDSAHTDHGACSDCAIFERMLEEDKPLEGIRTSQEVRQQAQNGDTLWIAPEWQYSWTIFLWILDFLQPIHAAFRGLHLAGDRLSHPDEQVILEWYEKGLTLDVLEHTGFRCSQLHALSFVHLEGNKTYAVRCPMSEDRQDFWDEWVESRQKKGRWDHHRPHFVLSLTQKR